MTLIFRESQRASLPQHDREAGGLAVADNVELDAVARTPVVQYSREVHHVAHGAALGKEGVGESVGVGSYCSMVR